MVIAWCRLDCLHPNYDAVGFWTIIKFASFTIELSSEQKFRIFINLNLITKLKYFMLDLFIKTISFFLNYFRWSDSRHFFRGYG